MASTSELIANPKERIYAKLGALAITRSIVFLYFLSFLLYVALFLLLRAKSFRLTQTLTLQMWGWLRAFSDLLTPSSFDTATWRSAQAGFHELLFAVIIVLLVGSWLRILWVLKTSNRDLKLLWILLGALGLSIPLLLLPGMFSGDLYLYMFYGRIIAKYGDNPLIVPPNNYPGDFQLYWIYWKWLPSAYGPVWLMLSGALSAFGGDGLWSNIFSYKIAVLILHVLTTMVVWLCARSITPEHAGWAAVFYGWNPLVLHETVGSGHNDVMVALFVSLALLSALRKRWLFAVFFLVAGSMVKLTTIVLLPSLLLVWLMGLESKRERLLALIKGIGVALVSGLILYAPLWAGTALFTNSLNNPAAQRYLNSLWELILMPTMKDYFPPPALDALFDIIRNSIFAVFFFCMLFLTAKKRSLQWSWIWLWFGYCLTLSWIWPWYFLLLIAVIAVYNRDLESSLGIALTLGGFLFWMGWPDPPLPAAPWLYYFRSIILLVPAIAVVAVPRFRHFMITLLGTRQVQ